MVMAGGMSMLGLVPYYVSFHQLRTWRFMTLCTRSASGLTQCRKKASLIRSPVGDGELLKHCQAERLGGL
jgi:hypothetical protein